MDRPPSTASNARAVLHDCLIELVLGDPGLKLFENSLALGYFQTEVGAIGSVKIANNRHELGYFQSLAVGVDRLQPHRPFNNSSRLRHPLRCGAPLCPNCYTRISSTPAVLLLMSKDIPQGGPVQWGRITQAFAA